MLTPYQISLQKKKLGLTPDPEKKLPKRISIKSVKRISEEKLYLKKKKEYLTAHIKCEVKGCNRVADDLHHKKSRIGKLLWNEKYFMAVCREHHRQITDDSIWAIKNKYSISRLNK